MNLTSLSITRNVGWDSQGKHRVLRALFVAALLTGSLASAAWAQEAVPGIGRMTDIAGAHEEPDSGVDYKIVFDMRTMGDSTGSVSPALQAVAGLVNTYRHYGVPADHLHVAAVFHGPTIVLLADDATYRNRTGFATNPNVDLLAKLRHAGVTMMVCGQSALAQHYDLAMLARAAQVNLSATVTFINLKSRGYVEVEE